jgi:transposase-like protein
VLGSQHRQRAQQGRPLGPDQHDRPSRDLTRAAAEAAIDVFADKYDKAFTCLTKDREALLAFFDFPAERWDDLRTSNPIESVFATVRHHTVRTKGALSASTAKLMVFKLVNAAVAIEVKPVAESRPRRQISKRHRGHRNAGSPRRLSACMRLMFQAMVTRLHSPRT